MSNLRTRIGGDGPVVAETTAAGWRLIVHGKARAAGHFTPDLHVALRELAVEDDPWLVMRSA